MKNRAWTPALLLLLGLLSCESSGGMDRLVVVLPVGEGSGAVRDGEGVLRCFVPAGPEGCRFYIPEGQGSLDLVAVPQENSVFTGWMAEPGEEGAGACAVPSGSSCRVDLEDDGRIVVRPRFELPGVVIVKVVGNGTVTGPQGIACSATDDTACRASFARGQNVTLTAAGAGFTGWAGRCVPTATDCVLSAEGTQEYAAYFGTPAPAIYRLMLSPGGPRPGRIREAVLGPGSLDCRWDGTERSGICDRKFPLGKSVDLVTERQPGDTIAFFGPGPCSINACTITMLSDLTIGAEFHPRFYQLTVLAGASIHRSGTVVSEPGGIGCAIPGPTTSYGNCGTMQVLFGSWVNVRVHADPGAYRVDGVAPCADGDGLCIRSRMTADRTVRIRVANQSYRLIMRTGATDVAYAPVLVTQWTGNSYQYAYSSSYYPSGSSVEGTDTISLAPQAVFGATFAGWGGACTGMAVPCVLPVNGDLDVTLYFTVP